MTANPSRRPVLIVEDDPFTRLLQVILDPSTAPERAAAFADFFQHDLADFAGWCDGLRARAPALWPAEVRLVRSADELRDNLADGTIVVVESERLGAAEIEAAHSLRIVQKFGTNLRNIDLSACDARGIKVLTLRRRANIACAEHALGVMLALAKRLPELNGLVTAADLEAAGYPYRPFDGRHTPGSNYGRIPGLRMLFESTVGIIGVGEIGREIALRVAAFGMRSLYFQRTRLDPADEAALGLTYVPLDTLLAESDWVIPQLPSGPATRHLLDRDRLSRMKPGACLVNVSRADVIERTALIDALRSGHLGGFALDPLYQEPAQDDDELLGFDNVILTPHTAAQPRFNALRDFEDMIVGLAREISP